MGTFGSVSYRVAPSCCVIFERAKPTNQPTFVAFSMITVIFRFKALYWVVLSMVWGSSFRKFNPIGVGFKIWANSIFCMLLPRIGLVVRAFVNLGQFNLLRECWKVQFSAIVLLFFRVMMNVDLSSRLLEVILMFGSFNCRSYLFNFVKTI